MARSTVYNSIVNEDNWGLVCNENKELLDEFVEYCHTTDKSDLTVVNYVSDIKIYFCWNLTNNKNKKFSEIKKRDVMKYQNYLMNTLGLGSSRVRRLKSSLSSLSNFIETVLDEEEAYKGFRNIINKIPAPVKNAVRDKTILTKEDIDKILSTLVEKGKYQSACMLSLALASGMRKSELTRMKVDFFNDDNIVFDCMYKTPEIKTKGRGKQGKKLKKYVFIDQFKPYFDLWVARRKELNIDSEWLFVTHGKDGYKQASPDSLSGWANSFSKILGKDFYLHSCRHYWTTSLSEKSIPTNVIKSLQGWSSVEMVTLYSDLEVEDTFGEYFGSEGIKEVKEKSLSGV